MKAYKTLKNFFLILISSYICIILIFLTPPKKKEIFPFFSWSLFSFMPQVPQVDFSLLVLRVGDRKFDPPRALIEVPELKSQKLDMKNSYFVIQQLGQQIKNGNLKEANKFRSLLEKEYINNNQSRVKYSVVEKSYYPIEMFNSGKFSYKRLKNFTLKGKRQ